MSESFQKEEFPPEMKKIRGSCVDCYGILTLFEEDFINKTRILVCEQCGLLHLYKKTLLSGWKLVKVRKKASTSE